LTPKQRKPQKNENVVRENRGVKQKSVKKNKKIKKKYYI